MYEISRARDIAILHLFGELNLLEMELLEKVLRSFSRHRHCKILLDLTGVDHLHFQAARKLAQEALRLRTQKGELKVACPNETTRQIFRFTGADQYLEDYRTVSEAILSFLQQTQKDEEAGIPECM